MYFIIKKWLRVTNNKPFFLSYDNAKHQATADIRTLYHPDHPKDKSYAIKVDPLAIKLQLPPYSHDLNRPIEHVFGTMKHKIRGELYTQYKKYNTPQLLQAMVYEQFTKHVPQGMVEKDVKGLPLLWEVLSTAAGAVFTMSNDQEAVGTGGDWPNAYFR